MRGPVYRQSDVLSAGMTFHGHFPVQFDISDTNNEYYNDTHIVSRD